MENIDVDEILEGFDTVSSGDALSGSNAEIDLPGEEIDNTVSGNVVSGFVTTEQFEEFMELYESTLTNEQQTIWEKPLEEYTVTEGLLLIIVIIALWFTINKFVGGIFK